MIAISKNSKIINPRILTPSLFSQISQDKMGAVDPQMLAIGALLSLGAIAYSIKEANDPKNKNKGNEKVGPKQKYI